MRKRNKKARGIYEDRHGFALSKKIENLTYIQKWMNNKVLTFDIAKTIPREILSLPVDVGRAFIDPFNKKGLERQSMIFKTINQSRKTDDPLNTYFNLAATQSKFIYDKIVDTMTHPIETLQNRIGTENIATIMGIMSSQKKSKHRKMSGQRTGRMILQAIRGRV